MQVNDWEFFHEMLDDAAWYHDDTEASLEHWFRTLTPADVERGKIAFRALPPRFAWPALAAQTLDLLFSLDPQPASGRM